MGEITDLTFLLLGKLGRWYNVKGMRICFVIWSICLVYWTMRNYGMSLWMQTGGCAFSLLLHAYGHWNWKDKGIGCGGVNWVSLQDRVPEKEGNYLIYSPLGPMIHKWYGLENEDRPYESHGWKSNYGNYFTHWMPLPKSPTENK